MVLKHVVQCLDKLFLIHSLICVVPQLVYFLASSESVGFTCGKSDSNFQVVIRTLVCVGAYRHDLLKTKHTYQVLRIFLHLGDPSIEGLVTRSINSSINQQLINQGISRKKKKKWGKVHYDVLLLCRRIFSRPH